MVSNRLDHTCVSHILSAKLCTMSGTIHQIGTASVLAAKSQIVALIAELSLQDGDKFPSERDLAVRLNLSRRALRGAFEILEAEGALWRSVGKGTFLGQRPLVTGTDITVISKLTNPIEIMHSRLVIEPSIAAIAAMQANEEQLMRIRLTVEKSRALISYDAYEMWDERFHSEVARASGHRLLQALFATVTKLRSETSWGNLRRATMTRELMAQFGDRHSEILHAIEDRDASRAEAAMKQHLQDVFSALFGRSIVDVWL